MVAKFIVLSHPTGAAHIARRAVRGRVQGGRGRLGRGGRQLARGELAEEPLRRAHAREQAVRGRLWTAAGDADQGGGFGVWGLGFRNFRGLEGCDLDLALEPEQDG